MTQESDINDALNTINQNMLLNKKKIDIDNIVDSILLFFNNYFNNLSIDVKNKIFSLINIEKDDIHTELIGKLITSFFSIIENKIKDTTSNKFNDIKDKVQILSDNECNKELNRVSLLISNEMADFYIENANDLISELSKSGVSEKEVSDYILKIVFNRVSNTLKDRLMYSIKVIDNNYEENNQIIQNINEKTVMKV